MKTLKTANDPAGLFDRLRAGIQRLKIAGVENVDIAIRINIKRIKAFSCQDWWRR